MKKLMYLSLVGIMGLMMSCGGNTESEEVLDDVDPVIEDTTATKASDEVVETPAETTEDATDTKAAE